MLKCKLNEKLDCRLAEFLKRKVNEQDCFCCFAMVFKGGSDELISIIADIGAGKLYREFMDIFAIFTIQADMFRDLLYRCYPEIEEGVKKKMESGFVVAPCGAIPKEVEEAIRKYINKAKTGDGVV